MTALAPGSFFFHHVRHQDPGFQSQGVSSTHHLFDHEIATMMVSANSQLRCVGRSGAPSANRPRSFGQGMTRATRPRANRRIRHPTAQDPAVEPLSAENGPAASAPTNGRQRARCSSADAPPRLECGRQRRSTIRAPIPPTDVEPQRVADQFHAHPYRPLQASIKRLGFLRGR